MVKISHELNINQGINRKSQLFQVWQEFSSLERRNCFQFRWKLMRFREFCYIFSGIGLNFNFLPVFPFIKLHNLLQNPLIQLVFLMKHLKNPRQILTFFLDFGQFLLKFLSNFQFSQHFEVIFDLNSHFFEIKSGFLLGFCFC